MQFRQENKDMNFNKRTTSACGGEVLRKMP